MFKSHGVFTIRLLSKAASTVSSIIIHTEVTPVKANLSQAVKHVVNSS